MPDEVKTNPASTPAEQPAAPAQYKMPEKFAGKSPEDIAKAYSELESTYGKTQARLKEYEPIMGLGSAKEVQAAIDWARNINQKLQSGELTYKQAQKELQKVADAAPAATPFDDANFDLLSPREQAKAIAEYNKTQLLGEVEKLISGRANEFAERFTGFEKTSDRKLELFVNTLEKALANPGKKSISEILKAVVERSNKTPEQLMDEVINYRSQEDIDAEIERRSNEKAAILAQERENNRIADLAATNRVRTNTFLNPERPKNGLERRNQETKDILKAWEKIGIHP